MNRFVRRFLVVLISAVALLTPSAAATAATESKASVLSRWTQTTAASTDSWNSARLNRSPWASYGFDWSTDYCSSSPDNPLGFDFQLSCWHHDFGYRNYKDIGAFAANKARLDNMFYADLKRKCATYSSVVRPACLSLAWTYYQAVSVFGSLEAVNPSDIDRARALIDK
ncbi:phospholipase [Actinoplanes sp. NPDC049118]|uniref:phospholipase n=1 Tax=Actinoplanes sp. NPDC049118 TaxID=3155769 RepID=UPI0033F3F2A9